MLDNPNTDNQTQHPLMDREDWEIAFEPYEGHPGAALRFGFNVAILRTSLDIAECNLHDELRADVHDVTVPACLPRE